MGSTGRAFMEGVSIGVGYHLADRMATKAMNREAERIRREKERQQRKIQRQVEHHNYKMTHDPRYRQNYLEDQHQHTLVEQHRHSLTQSLPPERQNANNPFMF